MAVTARSVLCRRCLRSRLFTLSSADRRRGYADSRQRWKILMFGSSEFGLETLKTLHDNSRQTENRVVDTVSVVTAAKTPIRHLAEERNITVMTWPPDLTGDEFDVGVVVSFGHLIPAKIIKKFDRGILNVHPSLLPRWRGAAPVTHTILAGDRQTGVSIMEIRPKRFDIGPILMQTTVPVPDNITTKQLSSQLSALGARMLLETLSDLDTRRANAQVQPTEGDTYARKLTVDMAHVNWSEQSCDDIDRQYRALSDQIPLRSRYLGKPIQLLDMLPLHVTRSCELDHATPGTPRYVKELGAVCIRCKDGWIGFGSCVYKKTMSAHSFYNGYLSKQHHQNEILGGDTDNSDSGH